MSEQRFHVWLVFATNQIELFAVGGGTPTEREIELQMSEQRFHAWLVFATNQIELQLSEQRFFKIKRWIRFIYRAGKPQRSRMKTKNKTRRNKQVIKTTINLNPTREATATEKPKKN